MYPSIAADGWSEADGFFRLPPSGKLHKRAPSLQVWQPNLLGHSTFGAPPTMLVSSTTDTVTPPREHTDAYVALLRDASVPYVYIRRNMGEHGFVLQGDWTSRCVKWLRRNGFGV